MKIAVLGGGNGAYAAAADLSEQGHEVRFWRRDAPALAGLQAITLKDADGERAVPISQVCTDIGDAVRGAELVFMSDPAFTQADNARRLAPHLSGGQVVFLAPGTFGAYLMPKMIRESGNRADFSFAETGTLPWLTRKHGSTTAAITARATRLPTGVFPARNSQAAYAVLGQAFRSIEP